MATQSQKRLLGPDDPDAVAVINAGGRSSFLLVGDHAGVAIPESLARLGLGDADLQRHIACDLGSWALGSCLAEALDAVFIHQVYSRLVVDCNRDPASDEAVLSKSDGTAVPGNTGLSLASINARIQEIHRPYHDAIARELDVRANLGQHTILCSLHSFTAVLAGVERPWHVGILHDGHNDAFARKLLQTLRTFGKPVGDNAPYAMDATDYTVPHHAFSRGLPYVEVEIRQDLLATPESCTDWASRLTSALSAALSNVRSGL